MAYTVKKIAKLSGVSIRTLRWYDTIGILHPAYYGENGYRYYEEEQLMTLQQILFFRELGFPLNDIKGILEKGDFDQIKSLKSHRKSLIESLMRTKELIKTIDKTLLHLRGKYIMENKELYQGFHDWAEGKGGESFYLGTIDGPKTAAEKIMLKNVIKRSNENKDKSYYENLEKQYKEIYGNIASCIDKGLEPTSAHVQKLIEKHHTFAKQFYKATKEVYIALADVCCEKPEFRAQLEPFHPKLPEYMAEGMKAFAESKL